MKVKSICKITNLKSYIICLFLLINLPAFSIGLDQKIYRTDCLEYSYICQLFIAQGKAFPSSTAPWSGAELKQMLELIDSENLNDSELKLYNAVYNSLYSKPRFNPNDIFGFTLQPNIDLELYGHTNNKDFLNRNEFAWDEMKTKPFLDLQIEAHMGDFYGFSTLDVSVLPTHTIKELGETYAATNIPGFQNFTIEPQYDFNASYPERSFASCGGDYWTLQVGKDRIRWGNGSSGNLVISDNLPFHNFAKLTTFTDVFKYTYLIDFFPHPMNYGKRNRGDIFDGLRFYQAHRVEGAFFNHKFRVTLTESLMHQSENGIADLQTINPVALLHNYFIHNITNSALAAELDYTPVKNWNIYGQWIIDQAAVAGEGSPKKAEGVEPNAMGYMGGLRYNHALGKGLFYAGFETAYTDPFLYLRNGNANNSESGYNIDYVVAIRKNSCHPNGPVFYDKYFLGYKYGGDAIVLNLTSGWNIPGKYGFDGKIFYMLHGTFDADSQWRTIGASNYKEFLTPTTGSGALTNSGESRNRSGVQNTLNLETAAHYYIRDNIKVFGQLDFWGIWNKNFQRLNAFDVQLVTGVSLWI